MTLKTMRHDIDNDDRQKISNVVKTFVESNNFWIKTDGQPRVVFDRTPSVESKIPDIKERMSSKGYGTRYRFDGDDALRPQLHFWVDDE